MYEVRPYKSLTQVHIDERVVQFKSGKLLVMAWQICESKDMAI
jgi:hypothetical protein